MAAGDPAAGPYQITVQAGGHGLREWPLQVDFGGVAVAGRADMKRSWQAGLAIGRDLGPLRLALEWQHGRLPIKQVTLGPVRQAAAAAGHYDLVTINAEREFSLTAHWRALAAVGLGQARVRMPAVPLGTGCNCLKDADASGFSPLARIGLAYDDGGAIKPQVAVSWVRLPAAASGSSPATHYPARGLVSVSLGASMRF